MVKTFKHPLARAATLSKLRQRDGGEQGLLVIVTTLELEASAAGFNAKNFERLHDAAKSFLEENKELAGYILVNRPKEWGR